jgi:hypothetical protein
MEVGLLGRGGGLLGLRLVGLRRLLLTELRGLIRHRLLLLLLLLWWIHAGSWLHHILLHRLLHRLLLHLHLLLLHGWLRRHLMWVHVHHHGLRLRGSAHGLLCGRSREGVPVVGHVRTEWRRHHSDRGRRTGRSQVRGSQRDTELTHNNTHTHTHNTT